MTGLDVGSADPFDRYGLRLVDEPSAPTGDSHARADPGSGRRRLTLFDWSMLTGFAVLQIAYLYVLVLAARWALRQLIAA